MRHPSFPRARVALALLVAACAASGARAQAADPALAQRLGQLQPMSPTPAAVQQAQAAPQPLPSLAPAGQPVAVPSSSPSSSSSVVAQAVPPEPPPAAAAQPQAALQPAPQPAPGRPPQPERRHVEFGATTSAWLDLQRSNRAASPAPHPFEGAAATYAYQRYLQSFSKPIPDWFGSAQSVGGGGAGGSQSGGSGLQSQ